MKIKVQIISYLVLISCICFTGVEIFNTLNTMQKNYLSTYSELLN